MTDFVRRLLAGSRYIILLSVIGTFIAAVVLTLYGVVAVVVVSVRSFLEIDGLDLNHHVVERVALEYISLIDIFLLCTVLYIVAVGLYELFIDPNLPLPQWLLIEDLDDLKQKLGGVVIVLIGVNFLGDFVQSDGDIGILWLGLSGAAIILATAVAFAFRPRHGPSSSPNHAAAPVPNAGGDPRPPQSAGDSVARAASTASSGHEPPATDAPPRHQ